MFDHNLGLNELCRTNLRCDLEKHSLHNTQHFSASVPHNHPSKEQKMAKFSYKQQTHFKRDLQKTNFLFFLFECCLAWNLERHNNIFNQKKTNFLIHNFFYLQARTIRSVHIYVLALFSRLTGFSFRSSNRIRESIFHQ